MKNVVLCCDAQNLLKLSFFGNKTTFTKEFGHLGAIKTFYDIIRKLIKEYDAKKVILFWDGNKSGSLRHDIYPEYKSNRGKDWNSSGIILNEKDIKREENSEVSILKSRERIKNYAEEFFFRQFEDEICEADDCIAYYVNNLLEPNELAIIVSADHDFCGLIKNNTYLYLLNLKSLVSPKNYFLYFDHHISNVTLIKAIEGCKGDMIHGVESLGEKTLLKYFPELKTTPLTFDYIYDKAIEINKGRNKPLGALKNLIEGKTLVPIKDINNGKDLFELNFKLVNLKEPFMTDDAIDNLEIACTAPISDINRGGKNILKMMYQDGWIKEIPGGPDRYAEYLMVLLPIVKKEKQIYQEYLSNL